MWETVVSQAREAGRRRREAGANSYLKLRQDKCYLNEPPEAGTIACCARTTVYRTDYRLEDLGEK